MYNILANDHIGDLASNITELFIVQAGHLTEGQLYVVVEAILSATDPVWQGFTMLNTSFNVAEVHTEQVLQEQVTDVLPGAALECYT